MVSSRCCTNIPSFSSHLRSHTISVVRRRYSQADPLTPLDTTGTFDTTQIDMPKTVVFTTITPLPAGITRKSVLDMYKDHLAMIDLNPLVVERYKCKPPAYAPTSEYYATWYTIKGAHYRQNPIYPPANSMQTRSHICLGGWRPAQCPIMRYSTTFLIVLKPTSTRRLDLISEASGA